MLFYIVIGIITALLAHMMVTFYDRNKMSAYIFCLLFIIIPSMLEGCRNVDVGTDMLGYGSLYFYNAASCGNIGSFLADLDTKEYGYHLLCYFCAKIGGINFYMFVAALIKMTMLALTCIFFRKKTIVWLAVFCYMLFFYWYGFSLMRQSLALCVSLYSLTFLYGRKYVAFSACMLVAYLFHNSAVFMSYMLAVIYMARFRHRLFYVSAGVGVVYIFASVLFVYIATSGLFGESKLDLYMDSGVASAKSNIVIMVVYILMPFILKVRNRDIAYYIRACAILGLMFLMLSSLFEVAFRVSFYQMLPLLFLVPALILDVQGKTMRNLCKCALVCLFLAHITIAASHGMSDTIPYKSEILGIG